MTLKELMDQHGNDPLPIEALKVLGIYEKEKMDMLLNAEDITLLTPYKSNKAALIIRQLKNKFDLHYDESAIPASIFAKYYGMDTTEILTCLEKQKMILLEQDQKRNYL
ncbi:hypothetical protein [Beduini massiliensis]|uniref:hypothetical protein n=1 Tax=Beduini massiliensis TaxID=1585974 RepID=UPI00059AB0F2|nr:hypothetical protein [Beduini massiliensis]